MIHATIRELRKRNAWSQAHLAEAAGLSVRTIQRIEQTGHCSDESLLSIAAALDVDVQILSVQSTELPIRHDSRLESELLFQPIPVKTARLGGILLLAPAFLFIASNVLKYELNSPALYDTLYRLGELLGLQSLAPFLTGPFLLLGGPALAAVLSVLSQVRISGRSSTDRVDVHRIGIAFDLPCTVILLGAMIGIATLLGYAAVENISHWILEIVGE